MFLARRGHFRRRAEMKPSVRAFVRVFLAEQRQRADGLHDVVFHPVGGRWRNESPGQATTGNAARRWQICASLPSDRTGRETVRPAARPG